MNYLVSMDDIETVKGSLYKEIDEDKLISLATKLNMVIFSKETGAAIATSTTLLGILNESDMDRKTKTIATLSTLCLTYVGVTVGRKYYGKLMQKSESHKLAMLATMKDIENAIRSNAELGQSLFTQFVDEHSPEQVYYDFYKEKFFAIVKAKDISNAIEKMPDGLKEVSNDLAGIDDWLFNQSITLDKVDEIRKLTTALELLDSQKIQRPSIVQRVDKSFLVKDEGLMRGVANRRARFAYQDIFVDSLKSMLSEFAKISETGSYALQKKAMKTISMRLRIIEILAKKLEREFEIELDIQDGLFGSIRMKRSGLGRDYGDAPYYRLFPIAQSIDEVKRHPEKFEMFLKSGEKCSFEEYTLEIINGALQDLLYEKANEGVAYRHFIERRNYSGGFISMNIDFTDEDAAKLSFILGISISPTTKLEELDVAYRKYVKHNHSDKGGDDEKIATVSTLVKKFKGYLRSL